MAVLEKIEFIEIPNVRIIGCEVKCSLKDGTENAGHILWDRIWYDGTIEMLKKLPLAINHYTIGWMGEAKDQSYTYIAGVIAVENTPVPEGIQYRDLIGCNIAKGFIKGAFSNGDVFINAHNLTVNGIETNNFMPDYSIGWSAEIYPNDLDFNSTEGTISYLLPYKK